MAQEENGAAILDINMGMNGIDEKEMMKQVIYEVAATVDCRFASIPAILMLWKSTACLSGKSTDQLRFP